MYGRKIPAGWALDAAGNPTDVPSEAKTLLPAAGARGYGLAFLCSILAGPLVGILALVDLPPVADAFLDGPLRRVAPVDLQEAVRVSHDWPP